MKKYLSLIAAAAVILSLTGCSDANRGIYPEPGSGSGSPSSTPSSSPSSGSSKYEATDIEGHKSSPSNKISGFVEEEGICYDTAEEFAGGAMHGAAPSAAPAADGGFGAKTETDDYPTEIDDYPDIYAPQITPEAGLLTGGEWRDNDHWDYWDALYQSREDWEEYRDEWKNYRESRIAVKVTADGEPLEGATVSCNDYTAVTDNRGMAYLFYSGQPGAVAVACGNVTKEIAADGDEIDEIECDLSGAVSPISQKLDLMIMCDTTGSMGDELDYLKEELKDVVTRIQAENGNIPVRVSINFYRDSDDEYEVRQYPFSEDIDEVSEAIGEQNANGGGDFPEAVHTALDSALNKHDWDEDSVKVMFLVLDAPPHNDEQIIDSVNEYIDQAAEMGVRIVPVASSGIDKSTEYLLRTMAMATGGTYTFLTDDSGIGGGHLEPTVGDYTVEKLNEMMIRIVDGYLGDGTSYVAPVGTDPQNPPKQTGSKPFEDLTANDIKNAVAEIIPNGESRTLYDADIDELVSLLGDVVIYEQDDSYSEYVGSSMRFIITKNDGTIITFEDYGNAFAIIDGMSYKSEYEPMEALNQFVNDLF